ncbi:6034_t:CDS:10, partial [Acaulospora colombiana]
NPSSVKYVGLLALAKILPTHPRLVSEHRDIILKCIDDPDISIRLRALDLVVGMVNKKNLSDIVKRLMSHLLPSNNNNTEDDNNGSSTNYPPPSTLFEPAYRADIINRIIYICSQNSYSNITNFEWYIAVLIDLTNIAGVKVDKLLTSQIMDVGVRVKSVRQYCVKTMQRLLSDKNLLENCKLSHTNAEVLYAAAWITGEYCRPFHISYLENPLETIEYLIQPGVTKLPHSVQAVYVHSILKIYAFWANNLSYSWNDDAKQELAQFTSTLREKVGMFCSCPDLEVQERAYNIREILSIIYENLTSTPKNDFSVLAKPPQIISEIPPLFFSYELNPVAPKAQKKVPIPEGLDLDAWINEPLPESGNSESEEEEESYGHGYGQKVGGSGDLIFSSGNGNAVGRRRGRKSFKYESEEEDEEIKERRRKERKERIKNDPFYIGDEKKSVKRSNLDEHPVRTKEEIDVDSIPVVRLTMDEFDLKSSNRKSSKSKKSKGSKGERVHSQSSPPAPPVVYTDIGEMPENATISDEEKELEKSWNTSSKINNGILDVDFSGVANIDLSTPLGEDEKLPQTTFYLSPEEVRRQEEARMRKKLEERRLILANERASKTKKTKEGKAKIKAPTETSKLPEKSPKSKKAEKVAIPEPTITLVEVNNDDDEVIETNHTNITPVKTLVDSDDIQIDFTLTLGSPTEKTNEPPTLIANFSLCNKNSLHLPLSQFTFTFESTSDIQFDNPLIEISDLRYQEKRDVSVDLRVLGIVGVGLTVSGNTTYTIQSDEVNTKHDIPIRFELPLMVFMLNLPRISSEQYATLISQTDFPFTGSTIIHLNATIHSADQAFQNELIRLTSFATGTHIVEQMPGAITIYGKSVQGYQVVGLAKLFVGRQQMIDDDESINEKTSVKIELKCTDQAFVDGLIREIEYLFREDS